jgi:hypothetical protein
MAHRWNAHYSFHWSPVVAFSKKRAEFEAWIDLHLQPRGVLDQQDQLGLAIDDPLLRVTISRTGFDISLGRDGLNVEPLEVFMGGLSEVFGSKDIHIAAASLAHSAAVDGEYEHLRRSFTARCLGPVPAGFTGVDVAALTDIESPTGTMSCEFGVVTDKELTARLTQRTLGRLHGLRGKMQEVHVAGSVAISPVNVFCETVWRTSGAASAPLSGTAAEIWEYVKSVVHVVEEEGSLVTDSVVESLSQSGGAREYGYGA